MSRSKFSTDFDLLAMLRAAGVEVDLYRKSGSASLVGSYKNTVEVQGLIKAFNGDYVLDIPHKKLLQERTALTKEFKETLTFHILNQQEQMKSRLTSSAEDE